MIENNDRIVLLIGKYLETNLDEAEQREFDEWLNAAEDNRRLLGELTDPQLVSQELRRYYAYDSNRISQKIAEEIPAFAAPAPAPVHRLHFLRRWGWAAAAVLFLGAGAWYWAAQQKTGHSHVAHAPVEIPPGRDGAILTLSDGRQVVLDSLANGVIAQQHGTDVVLSNGELTYDAGNETSGIAYNTMTTPRGRQFRVTLPDGTKAWLNAASSIRYPVAFTGSERKVDITGEVYFEVSQNASKPFVVNAAEKATILVLGTSFNVNAYENEKIIATTLITGAVKVASPRDTNKEPILMSPGEQGGVSRASGRIQLLTVDLDKIMAWKNGLFNFEGSSIEDVMRQLERWYDINVVYENGIPDITFLGEINRQIALPDLLEILRRTDVGFRIEGRTLIVLNN